VEGSRESVPWKYGIREFFPCFFHLRLTMHCPSRVFLVEDAMPQTHSGNGWIPRLLLIKCSLLPAPEPEGRNSLARVRKPRVNFAL